MTAVATTSQASSSHGLAVRVARGTLWTCAGAQANSVLTLATSVLIARILDPAALGRYALISTIIAILGTASSLQSGGYYVVVPRASALLLRTGLALELALGTICLLGVSIGAALYGRFTGDWNFCWLLLAASTVLLVNPFSDLSAFFQRDLAYRVPVVAQVVTTTAGVIVKMVLIVLGFGVAGLIAGDIVIAVSYGAAMLVAVPEARGISIDKELMRKQISFGVPTLGSAFLNIGAQRLPEIAVASILGIRDLGIFYLAYRLPGQIYQLGRSLSQALLPAFSRSSDAQLARAYALTSRFSAFFMGLPLSVAVPLAPAFVAVVFGRRWESAGTLITLLLVAFAIRFVFWHVGNLLRSRERVVEMTILNAAQVVLTAVASFVGAAVGGLTGLGIGILAVELILIVPRVRLVRSVVPFSLVATLGRPLLTVAAAAIVALASSLLLSAVPALVVASVLATVLFVASAATGDRQLVSVVFAAVRRE